MKQFSVVALSILLGIAAGKEGCEDLEAEVRSLKAQLADAQHKVDSAISVIGIISHTSNLAGESVKGLLDSTDVDEQLYDKVNTHLGAAKQATVDFLGKVQNIDYRGHWSTVTNHDVYKTQILPAVDSVQKAAEPYMKDHVHPTINKAHEAIQPHLATATKHLNENVYPAFQQATSKVYEHADFSLLTSKLGGVLDPLFSHVAKNHPKIAKYLPGDAWDRILFLIVAVISFYYFVLTTYFLVKKALWMTRTTTSLVVQLFIVFPLWILWKLIRLALCLSTCGFCCGLCWRRKPAEKANGKAKEEKKNGEKKAEPAKKVTVDEISSLLEGSKKKGKTEEAAKLLVTHAQNGKALTGKNFPDNVKNKVLDKDTLKKAIAKYKELDAKKLGL